MREREREREKLLTNSKLELVLRFYIFKNILMIFELLFVP